MTNPRIMQAVLTYVWENSNEALARAQRQMQNEAGVWLSRHQDFCSLSRILPECQQAFQPPARTPCSFE